MLTDTLTTTMPITYTILTVPSGGYVTVEARVTYGEIMVSGLLVFLIAIALWVLAYTAAQRGGLRR
jgi:hypothetical protein